MTSNRLRIFLRQGIFSEALQRTSSNQLQPRTSTHRLASIFWLFLLACGCAFTASSSTAATLGTLSVTPGSASFGNVAIGTKNSQTLQIKNTGAATMTISSATLSSSSFSMSSLYIPLWLGAGQSINLTITFAPTSLGSKTATITLKSNSSNPTVTIALSGTGVTTTKSLSLSSSSLSFGNETVGSSSQLNVSVKNTGNASVKVASVSVSGTGFTATGGLTGATIAAGQTANLGVVFAPKGIGLVTGKVTITSDASNTPSVATSGTGVSSTAHSVALSWNASASSGVVGYFVYRSTTSGGAYARLNSVATTATKYTDGSVSSGTKYYYVVTTLSSSGAVSGYSSQIAATVP